MGDNKSEVCSGASELLSSEWFKLVLSAAVGATASYLFSNYASITKANYLRRAMYEEANHVLFYVISYFEAVLEESEKGIIDLGAGDSLYGPQYIDFSIFHEIVKASITSKRPPNRAQRQLTHNIEKNILSTFEIDKNRYHDSTGAGRYHIKREESLHIASRLCSTIFHLGQFVDLKDKFDFDAPSNEIVVDYVLKKSSLRGVNENSLNTIRNELIKKIRT
ncbi:hypothetical protein [Methylophaga sp.]|uniref:hypothetical protein n=1 Tax=Methylophaga sp. TaxID=2024840 RepID=UPI003A90AEB4